MSSTPRSCSTWLRRITRRILRVLGFLLLVLVGATALRCFYAFHDRNPGYKVDVNIDGNATAFTESLPLRVGFARIKINPDLSDTNHPIWLAGFNQHRAATGIHDDLWAIACVVDDGHTRLGIVAIDAIGLFHDDVISVRRKVAPKSQLDYTIVCSTHNHSTPDLLGLWGPNYFQTGVDATYRARVISATAQALDEAAVALQPARVAFHEIPTEPDGLVADTREPAVFDPNIRVMHFTSPANGATIGSLVGWANHPETVWSKNTEITADFPGYLREVLENGVYEGDLMLRSGVGGIHLYVNGAIGGLMSTTPKVTVRDPFLDQDYTEPSHRKARALGRAIAARVLPKLEMTNAPVSENAPLSIRARTIELPLDNNGFLAAPVVGLLDRGHVRWKHIRSEVALITLGQASIACIPGEIYPEIVNGGIETPEGADYQTNVVEVPPIREFMPGKIKFIFGLANDEIGYIIPRSQYDRKKPYLNGAKRAPYGEINSVGPDAAATVHAALLELSGKTNQLNADAKP
ncbi:MAG TPA: hypothetical protein VK846_06500 [Candidatus Limnocylindria bacterium]|nr:hypothetical protein [Candidatus Limnocylindria bacterium]